MRHRNKINSLGRKAAHRKETMASMATALILHKRINTTVAKAKALRVYVEPLITRSKDDSTHSRRMVFSYLKNKHAVSELFREVAQKVADRPGGYTRILKTGFRKGDAAEMCFIELVDYNTAMLQTEEETQQKRTRRGRRRGKQAQPDQESVATAETQQASAEVPAEEAPGQDKAEETPGQDKAEETDNNPEATVEKDTENKIPQESDEQVEKGTDAKDEPAADDEATDKQGAHTQSDVEAKADPKADASSEGEDDSAGQTEEKTDK